MKMIKQRLIGLSMVLLAAIMIWLASSGTTPQDRDATAALIVGPMGLWMMFTKHYVLYDEEPVSRPYTGRRRRRSRRKYIRPTPTAYSKKGALEAWQERE